MIREEEWMKKEVGLWIDRHKAVIVSISHREGGIQGLNSNLEKLVHFSGVNAQDGWRGNMHDRNFLDFLTHYYDDVIAYLLTADSIQIFGPGEAKLQLEQQLRREELGDRIVKVETVEKMTDRQIELKVWQHLLSH
jgi:hypothetical protein